MSLLRRFLMQHRAVAAWLVAAALLMKALVPAGYMLGSEHGFATVQLCSGYGPMQTAMPGMAHHSGGHDHGNRDRGGQPCAFSGLTAPALAGADPVLLAAAIAFVIAAVACRPGAPVAGVRVRLRPPLRGPPLPS